MSAETRSKAAAALLLVTSNDNAAEAVDYIMAHVRDEMSAIEHADWLSAAERATNRLRAKHDFDKACRDEPTILRVEGLATVAASLPVDSEAEAVVAQMVTKATGHARPMRPSDETGASAGALPPLVLAVTEDDDDLTCLLCKTPTFAEDGRSHHAKCEYSVRYMSLGGSANAGLHRRCYERAMGAKMMVSNMTTGPAPVDDEALANVAREAWRAPSWDRVAIAVRAHVLANDSEVCGMRAALMRATEDVEELRRQLG